MEFHLAGDVHGHVLRGGGGDVADLAVMRGGALLPDAHHVRPALVLAATQTRLYADLITLARHMCSQPLAPVPVLRAT